MNKKFTHFGGHNPVVTKLGRFSGRVRVRTHVDGSIVDPSLITPTLEEKAGRIAGEDMLEK